MKKEVGCSEIVLILFIAGIILFTGCSTIANLLPSKCPKSCEDKNPCTKDYCSEASGYVCKNDILFNCNGNAICEEGEYLTSTDCPDCADTNPCTVDTYDYSNKSCVHTSINNCCGNGICELLENRTSCPKDCPDCNDKNDCTSDRYSHEKNKCEYIAQYPCCGNGACEFTENYLDCPRDCPPSKEEQFAECTNDECKLNVALQFLDESICPKLLTVENTNKCHLEIAVKANRLELCEKIPDNVMLLDCKQSIAVQTNNTQLCLSALANPNLCLEKIAIKTDDMPVCNLLIEGFVATRDDFVKKCYAKVSKNYLNCKSIERSWIKDLCYRELALMLNDSSICEGVKENPQDCIDAVGGA